MDICVFLVDLESKVKFGDQFYNALLTLREREWLDLSGFESGLYIVFFKRFRCDNEWIWK